MKLWKYIHLLSNKITVPITEVYKTPYVISDTQPDPDYLESFSISDWYDMYNDTVKHYAITKQWCKERLALVGWASLTNLEKDAIIDLDLSDGADSVPYLMGNGMTLNEAKGFLLTSFAKDHVKNIEACSYKMNDEYLYIIIGKHLNKTEASTFFNLTQNLSSSYERQALKGTIDSPNMGVGLFDFIEDTVGTIYENAGLSSQGFLTNDGSGNVTPLQTELMNWFRYGIKA